MALSRRASRNMEALVWPGFVDAMGALVLVLIFVLSIFLILQSALRETITTQDSELQGLSARVANLTDALGLSERRVAGLESDVAGLGRDLSALRATSAAQAARIATLAQDLAAREGDLAAARTAITGFEAEVAALIAERAVLQGRLVETGEARDAALSEGETLRLALAAARSEIDAAAESARLDAARREAVEAALAQMQARAETGEASLAELLTRLEATETRLTARAESAEALAAAREARLAELASLDEAQRARLAELDARLDDLELARQAALAALASREAELTARIAELDAGLSDAELQRQLLLAELADAQESLVGLSEAEAARLAEAAAAEALRARLAGVEAELSEAERIRLADAAAAEALRARIEGADTELTALTLALEAERARAEDTLTLLAAARAAAAEAETAAAGSLTEAEARAALLALAQDELSQLEAVSAEDRRRLELLNRQVAELNTRVGQLQDLLGISRAAETQAQTQIEALGSDLNAALARVAFEESARAALEAERARNLERYRSEFFGELRGLLDGREGVRVVGDRFVFSSEVLFASGSADLLPEGRSQIAQVAGLLMEVAAAIPPEIDWILRVDGHTDNRALGAGGRYANNWELSQARALAVVLYLVQELGFPPERLAATGFGEFRPVAEGGSPEALALNRRIELKLTER